MSRRAEGTLRLPSGRSVSTLLLRPVEPRALYVLAHGAGAPMDSPFMTAIAGGLGNAGISTVRFEFPYMATRRRVFEL